MSREATTETPRIAGRLTGRHLQGRCDHGVILTVTCDDCRLAPQPAPDAGGEWSLRQDSVTFEWIIRPEWHGDGTVPFVITVTGERAAVAAAQIVSDHTRAAAVPKLVEALEGARLVLLQSKRNVYTDDLIAEIDAALSPPATATGDTEGEIG